MCASFSSSRYELVEFILKNIRHTPAKELVWEFKDKQSPLTDLVHLG